MYFLTGVLIIFSRIIKTIILSRKLPCYCNRDWYCDWYWYKNVRPPLDFGSWAWISSSDAILDCWKLLLIPGCPRNAEKFTKAPLSLDSMKSLDLPPDPQHFKNSLKVAKRKSFSVKCLFVFLNILTMSEIRRSEIADERNDTCSLRERALVDDLFYSNYLVTCVNNRQKPICIMVENWSENRLGPLLLMIYEGGCKRFCPKLLLTWR